jgi:hypothetical protein
VVPLEVLESPAFCQHGAYRREKGYNVSYSVRISSFRCYAVIRYIANGFRYPCCIVRRISCYFRFCHGFPQSQGLTTTTQSQFALDVFTREVAGGMHGFLPDVGLGFQAQYLLAAALPEDRKLAKKLVIGL